MARSVKVILEDDLDGGEASQSLNFAFEGKSYEIDLNDKNAEKLRDALAPFITAARKTSGGRGSSRGSAGAGSGTDKEKLQKIRLWAIDNGHQVNSRGRIASSVIEAYEAAH